MLRKILISDTKKCDPNLWKLLLKIRNHILRNCSYYLDDHHTWDPVAPHKLTENLLIIRKISDNKFLQRDVKDIVHPCALVCKLHSQNYFSKNRLYFTKKGEFRLSAYGTGLNINNSTEINTIKENGYLLQKGSMWDKNDTIELNFWISLEEIKKLH